jgi:cytochrome oxidase Cu insertion factor (SCO1/SenC/PrrC family)
MGRVFVAAATIAAVGAVSVFAHEAPSHSRSTTTLPPAGSYTLQHIMRAPDGAVVDTAGRDQQLARYTGGKITLLSFIFTRCGDVCPFAMETQQLARQQLEHSAGLLGKVRFVTLSFDPSYDTPEVMKRYASNFTSSNDILPWLFLTTRSEEQRAPLLDGFGQDLDVADDATDGALTHVLKVFLIDPEHNVREIYSTSFLTPEVLINDIETLAKEKRAPAAR